MRAELRRAAAAACIGAALCAGIPARAGEPGLPWQPDAVFGQMGIGEHVKSMAIGGVWDWDWERSSRAGRLTGYTELSLGEWYVSPRGDEQSATQFGVTPVLRLYPQGTTSGWFVEGGIGAYAIRSRDEIGTRGSSTTFSSGSHIGVGRRFGDRGEHELALRVQHVANAGIRYPNAGENFLQLRYVKRF